MTTSTDVDDLAVRLSNGLNGDPDQRAATQLLTQFAHGVWLRKLSGWPQYLCDVEDTARPGGLWINWRQLREDLAADQAAREDYADWADSYEGQRATEAEQERRWEQIPGRPWHGASGSEFVALRIALELAPGGLLGDGLPRLDPANTEAVKAAFLEVVDGRYIEPAGQAV